MSKNIFLEAIATCEQAIHQPFQPDSFQSAAARIGTILQSRGHFEEAVLWHTQAQLVEPDFAQIYTGLGRIYFRQERWTEAIAAYTHVLKLNPDLAEPHWKLTSIYQHQDQKETALHYWYKALAFSPDKATPDEHIKLGHALSKLGQVKESLNCYRRAIYVDQDNVSGYRELAEAYLKLGKQKESIAIYREAIQRVSKPGALYNKLAHIFQAQGQVDEAMATFELAIAHDPDYRWPYYGKTQLLIKQQRWDEVIVACRATLDQHPDIFWAYTQMGQALLATGQKTDAIACYQKACVLQGWPRCEAANYQFSRDCFTPKIPILQEHLQVLIGQSNLKALEVGSFEGMSACWFLEHILTHSTTHLTCIDRRFQPEFDENIAKTGAMSRVTQYTGLSETILPSLPDDSFDFIYIDGAPNAQARRQDGEYAWPKLKSGGIIIFVGYEWSDPKRPNQAAKLGIDAVLRHVQGDAKLLHRQHQVILQKR